MKYIVYCTTNLVNKKIYIGVHLCKTNKFDGYLGCGVYESCPSTYNKPKTAFQWKLEKLDKIESIEVKTKSRKVGQYDLEGNLINVFNTVSECSKKFSGCKHVLHGKRKTSGGYIFKYIE